MRNTEMDAALHLIPRPQNYTTISYIGFPVEFFCTKIVQKLRKDLLTFRDKIARNFDVFAHWCAKAISRKFWRKSWYLRVSWFCTKWLFLHEIPHHFRINTKPVLHEIAHSFEINNFFLHEISHEYEI